ncbi:MAG: 5-(carboxyamino)imidazole ribonucleotide synthase [Alphaproteobacteria bacterium]
MTTTDRSIDLSPPLRPGATIGIVGGGQLGRMTAMAAARLGYRVHIYTPETDSPAAQVADRTTVAAYDDAAALDAFAEAIDIATFEFENVPATTAQRLAAKVPLRPGANCLEIAQDRLKEKTFLNANGAPTAPFARIASPAELACALDEIGRPAVLKTATLGYDGKGQVMIGPDTDPAAAYLAMGADVGILEGFIDFALEVSVILARDKAGNTCAFDVVENRHANHILDVTLAPAAISQETARQAEKIATGIAEALNLVGLLAVELFVTKDGTVLVNEIAPRPHNSGHWTIDACVTSQFEQFTRAVCGLPLGDPSRHSDAAMKNLIGKDVDRFDALSKDAGAKIHLYGKTQALAGRKMGHVTWLYPKGSGPKVPD